MHAGLMIDVEAGFEGDIEEENHDMKDNDSDDDDGQRFAFHTLDMLEDDAPTNGFWQDFGCGLSVMSRYGSHGKIRDSDGRAYRGRLTGLSSGYSLRYLSTIDLLLYLSTSL